MDLYQDSYLPGSQIEIDQRLNHTQSSTLCPKMTQRIWLITGCTSGFGEQFVHSILARGHKAIATGRSLSKLAHLEAAGAAILQLDITDTQQSIRNTVAEAIAIYGRIDVLVNNASYISIGTWEDLEYAALAHLRL
jgi:NADP-dependent 3-hydroxy acid dehydrogenase YdfG